MVRLSVKKYEFSIWGVVAGLTIIIGPFLSGFINFINEACIAAAMFLRDMFLAIPTVTLRYSGLLGEGSFMLSVMQWMSDIVQVGLSHLFYSLILFFVIDSAYRFLAHTSPPVKTALRHFLYGSFSILLLWVILLVYSGFLA